MNREICVKAFTQLGDFLKQFETVDTSKMNLELNDVFYNNFEALIYNTKIYNGWFEEKQVRRALKGLALWLTEEKLQEWLSPYSWSQYPKQVAIIMAGNIPLVGFHDFASVLFSGNSVLVKLSSDDKHLLPFLAKILIHIQPEFTSRISFTQERLSDFDAIIATGSDNSARYFDHYFSGYPNIIRKNRNSIAILNGGESFDELAALADDVFAYYGLGCRNITKIYVPQGYDFKDLFQAFYQFKDILNNKKYANNYDYYRALYLMGSNDMIENGFLLLKKDSSIASPISMLHYEYYSDIKNLKQDLNNMRNKIQCIVTNIDVEGQISFGKTQRPSLTDYADGVDTMAFLNAL